MNPQNDSPQERVFPERIEWDGELRYKHYHHSSDRPYQASQILNIGTTGVCFVVNEEVAPGSVLILKLFQHQDYSPIKILAKVRCCEKAPAQEGYALDCLFHDLSIEEKGMIQEVVEEVCFIRRIRSTFHQSLKSSAHLKKGSSNGAKKVRSKRSRKKARKTHRAA